MATVLVTGGTGTLGRLCLPLLVQRGHDVRALTRQPRSDLPREVRGIVGDLTSGAGLAQAVAGVDAVLHLASATRATSTANMRSTDVAGTNRLIEHARRAGAPHLLYLSVVGVDRHPLRYYRVKRAAEIAVERGGLPFTVLRSTQFHQLVLRIVRTITRAPLVALVPGGVSVQPIDAWEVADRLVAAVGQPPAGRLADVGGPEVRTAEDLVTTYLRRSGRQRRVVAVSVPGRAARAFRRGVHLAPERAVGRITWEQFLERVLGD